MLLENKVAVVYGGAGGIGRAVAGAFAREGSRVYLAGRTAESLDAVAAGIRENGGVANTAVVDALDEQSVNEFVDSIVQEAGKIDISFNLISYGEVQEPLSQISVEDFTRPITNAVRTHFLTTRAASRHMVDQKSGVILLFGGGGPQVIPGLGGFKIALDAMEGLRRQWACELGEHGVRVVTLKTGGVPETIPDSFEHKEAITFGIEQASLLKRAATLDDVANAAVFVASDKARMITSSDVNISGGSIVD